MSEKIKFLAEIKEGEKATIEVFITQVYQVLIYFCQRCQKISDKMCECGNFPNSKLKISGVISDGTKTMPFKIPEKVSLRLLGGKDGRKEGEMKKELMSKSHILKGYIKRGTFFVESAR